MRPIYVDMAGGDLIAGILLSYMASKLGDSDAVISDSAGLHWAHERLWIVKTWEEWWKECRLSRFLLGRAKRHLESLGLIETSVYQFREVPMTHYRIKWDEFLAAYEKASTRNSEASE